MRSNIVDSGIKILLEENSQKLDPALKDHSLNQPPTEHVNSWEYARLFRLPLVRQRATNKSALESALTLSPAYNDIPAGYENTLDCEGHIDCMESDSSPVEVFMHYANQVPLPRHI